MNILVQDVKRSI